MVLSGSFVRNRMTDFTLLTSPAHCYVLFLLLFRFSKLTLDRETRTNVSFLRTYTGLALNWSSLNRGSSLTAFFFFWESPNSQHDETVPHKHNIFSTVSDIY
jgi:hypothetical protein